MRRLVEHRQDSKDQRGSSPENPFRIEGVSSRKSGVAKEYEILDEQFGMRGQDWWLNSQALLHFEGRSLDRMDLRLADGSTRSIYFDVTELFSLPRETAEEQSMDAEQRIRAENLASLFDIWKRGGREALSEELRRRAEQRGMSEN